MKTSFIKYYKKVLIGGFKNAWNKLGFISLILPILPTLVIRYINSPKPIDINTLFGESLFQWIGLFLLFYIMLWLVFSTLEAYQIYKELFIRVQSLDQHITDFTNFDVSPYITFSTKVKTNIVNKTLTEYIAELQIENYHDFPIVNCYTILQSLWLIPFNNLETPLNIGEHIELPERIAWRNKQYSDQDCRLLVPPNDVRISRIGVNNGSGFVLNFCKRHGYQLDYGIYQLEIKVEGEIYGEYKQLETFYGYIWCLNSLNPEDKKYSNLLFNNSLKITDPRFENLVDFIQKNKFTLNDFLNLDEIHTIMRKSFELS